LEIKINKVLAFKDLGIKTKTKKDPGNTGLCGGWGRSRNNLKDYLKLK
jgi:hypothetical protein